MKKIIIPQILTKQVYVLHIHISHKTTYHNMSNSTNSITYERRGSAPDKSKIPLPFRVNKGSIEDLLNQ